MICCNALKNSRQRQRQRQTQKNNNEFGQFSRLSTDRNSALAAFEICISMQMHIKSLVLFNLYSLFYSPLCWPPPHKPSALLHCSMSRQISYQIVPSQLILTNQNSKLSLLMYTDTMSLKICVMTCSYGASGLKMKMRCLVR